MQYLLHIYVYTNQVESDYATMQYAGNCIKIKKNIPYLTSD